MGKPRVAFRQCRICGKRGNRSNSDENNNNRKNKPNNNAKNMWIEVCDCVGSQVHYRCQADRMVTSGVIVCEQCRAPYRAITYSSTTKSFFSYILECDDARTALCTVLTLLVSMVLSVMTLVKTCNENWRGLARECTDFDFGLNRQSLTHNVGVVMCIHGKVIIPLVSIFVAFNCALAFYRGWQTWRATHFDVTIKEQPAVTKIRTAEKK